MTARRLLSGRPSQIAAVLLAALVTLWPASTHAITPGEEEKIGREFLAQAMRRLELVQDPLIRGGVEKIGRRLLDGLPTQPFAYTFYVVKDDNLNAFAAPAGQLFVNTGLLTAIKSEAELAGILAHEIAHASARHISRNIEQAAVTQGLTLAGIAAGLILGGLGGSSALGQGVVTGALAGGQSATLAYSRAFERQADQLGLAYLKTADYPGVGLVNGLMRLREKDYFGGTVPSYLSTHPATAERITWLQAQTADQPTTYQPSIPDFELFQTQTMAKYAAVELAEKTFRLQLQKAPEEAMGHYGLGIVLARKGQRDAARQHLIAALGRQPFNIWMRAALGKVSSQLGDDPAAIGHLSDLQGSPAYDAEARYYLGNSYINSGRPTEAIAVLEPLVSEPDRGAGAGFGKSDRATKPGEAPREQPSEAMPVRSDPISSQTFYLLARAHNDLGHRSDSHLYLGRHFLSQQKIPTAVFHLNKALSLATDSRQRKVIERVLAWARGGDPDEQRTKMDGQAPSGLAPAAIPSSWSPAFSHLDTGRQMEDHPFTFPGRAMPITPRAKR
jgi:predicted Zn-dependent protease